MTARGCAYGYVATKHGEVLRRIRVGEPGDFHDADGRACHDCAAGVGKNHHPGCDAERCPKCGMQMLGCLGDPDEPYGGDWRDLFDSEEKAETAWRETQGHSCGWLYLFTTKKEADRMTREQRETAKTLIDQARRDEIAALEAQFRASSHDPKEPDMARTDPTGNVKTDEKPKRQPRKPKTETPKASTASKAETPAAETAKVAGDELAADLVARVKQAIPTAERIDAKSGAYFRLLDGKRLLGYVNPSKKGLILDLATPTDKVPAGAEVKHGPTAKLPVKFKVATAADVAVAVKMIEAIPALDGEAAAV